MASAAARAQAQSACAGQRCRPSPGRSSPGTPRPHARSLGRTSHRPRCAGGTSDAPGCSAAHALPPRANRDVASARRASLKERPSVTARERPGSERPGARAGRSLVALFDQAALGAADRRAARDQSQRPRRTDHRLAAEVAHQPQPTCTQGLLTGDARREGSVHRQTGVHAGDEHNRRPRGAGVLAAPNGPQKPRLLSDCRADCGRCRRTTPGRVAAHGVAPRDGQDAHDVDTQAGLARHGW